MNKIIYASIEAEEIVRERIGRKLRGFYSVLQIPCVCASSVDGARQRWCRDAVSRRLMSLAARRRRPPCAPRGPPARPHAARAASVLRGRRNVVAQGRCLPSLAPPWPPGTADCELCSPPLARLRPQQQASTCRAFDSIRSSSHLCSPFFSY